MAAMARTPDKWRELLLERLHDQARHHRMFDAYYVGEHPLPDAPNGARTEFLRLMRLARSNWCELIVDAVAERLEVVGVRFGDAGADLDVWRTIWQPNNLDELHGQVHTEALIGGTAGVLVWPSSNGNDRPEVTVEHPAQLYVELDGGDPRRRRAAIKSWREDGDEYAVVMTAAGEIDPDTPAMVYKWIRVNGRHAWEPYAGPGDPGPAFEHPLGAVSAVPFTNKRRMIGSGVSELAGGITDIQDRINETLFNRITAARFSAFRQRWVTGMDIPVDPETGKPIEPFKAAVDRIWMAEATDTKFGEFGATDLAPFIKAVEADIQHLAAISRTPPHYLLGQSGAFPSGESLKATETGLVAKVKARALSFGGAWEEVIRLALGAMSDARGADDSLEVIWSDPESKGTGELVDALVKLGTIGVPNEELWRIYGASPQEVNRWRAMGARQGLAAAAAAPTRPATPPAAAQRNTAPAAAADEADAVATP